MRAIIIDDEEACRSSLETQLSWSCPEIKVIGKCSNIQEGRELIHELKSDLVFLDIEMPGGSGLDLLRSIQPVSFDVIFTTAYDEYALEAFRVHAQAYLLKPVDGDDLVKAVNHIKKKSAAKINVEALLTSLEGARNFNKIAFPVSDGLHFAMKEDVVRCESEGSYCHIHFQNGSRIFIAKTLKQVAAIIDDDQFIRVHHSHLVNMKYVRKYLKGTGGQVIMHDGSAIPVSRNKKDDFLGQF